MGLPVQNGDTRKTIAVDFDGVIADYSEGFKGRGRFGMPIEGASKFLKKLRDDGWKIIIWTARDELGQVRQYLESNDIPFDHINDNPDQITNSRKCVSDIYLDDRGVTFTGDWEKAYQDVKGFVSWEGRKRN